MALFTGKGDQGTTKMFDTPQGVRVSKTSSRSEALGAFDELNASVGLAKVVSGELVLFDQRIKNILHTVQDHLFTLQAEIAGSQKTIPQESVEVIEKIINDIEKQLPPITTFLVPGGVELSARLDVARTISRRAERRLVALVESGERDIAQTSRAYSNRLSSLFYALERWVNHVEGVEEKKPDYKS